MCGICCIFAPINEYNQEEVNKIFCKCEENLKRRGPDDQNITYTTVKKWNFLLSSTVLWLQGEKLTTQPVETEKSWFLYNGDIFGNEILSSNLRHKHGDTKPLLDAVENSESIIKTFSAIQGPYAFILIDKIESKLYFGRDTFGRRSLLIGKDNNTILLTSVASRKMNFPMIELPAIGIYCISLNLKSLTEIILYPWVVQNQHFSEKLNELKTFLSISIQVENCDVQNNVTFEHPNESDILILNKIESLKTDEAFKFIQTNDKWMFNILKLNSLLEDAIFRRINNQPPFCKDCIEEKMSCNHPLIGVLFSGGLDCAILSLLADKLIDYNRPIDLLNVAFEKGGNYETPDRITARQTLAELQKLRPNRKWNLLEINVTQDELNLERNQRISDLIYPLESILDESLGCALWFAARGKVDSYISPCRVLLVGMGADELFGGYTRHRAAFKRGNWEELTKELDTDWKNISHRNLARDDRVISDHGRQVRTPYLDENVVEFVRKLDAWDRCYPSDKIVQGLGDKLLLRSLAFYLGLTQAAVLRKRALQFGSRIANSKENAHEKSPRL